MTNFADELAAAVAEAGDRPALKLDDIVLNYSALEAAAARAAGMLRAKGVEAGDRVGMQCPTSPTSRSSFSGRSASVRSWCP
jgi:long-chain acyl-CoA synthetase